MRQRSLLCLSSGGFHGVAYTEWGAPDAERTVVCVHGLTGCGRDFDALASALASAGFRVVCPDVVGRGDSDWLADPERYGLRQYRSDMAALIARLDVDEVDWVGTSMGGMVGMTLAAAERTPIGRLVLNDIGPFVPTAALQRLASYLGNDPTFADIDAADAYLRETRAPFGALTPVQWRDMAERTTRPRESGGYRLHYDPGIAVTFGAAEPVDMWRAWDAIRAPTFVLRGVASDLLLADTAREMERRGPRAELVEIAGCGHNPPLLEEDEVALVVDWLRKS